MAGVRRVEPGLTFVTGGARSGKSAFAVEVARGLRAPTLYVATAEARDAEMRAKIRRHRAARPRRWSTLEEPIEITKRLAAMVKPKSVVIVDCLTLWASNLLDRHVADLDAPKPAQINRAHQRALVELRRLCALPKRLGVRLIVISNEVGSGIVPDNPISRSYRELLGEANQFVAQRADLVVLMVAGLPVEIGPALEI
ncbi:MAG: bifunctional adenosylcobinamide kinase/adenosylcobinamide-phosphate guanylyltransferase [Dehalococcoidia bacterium]